MEHKISAAVLAAFFYCGAAQAETILAFAKRTANKYPSEVSDVAIGEHLTGRATLRPYDLQHTYDASTKTLTLAYTREAAQFSTLTLWNSCKTTGSYPGQNAFGARNRVLKQSCEHVRVRGSDDKLPIGMIYHDVFGVKIRGVSPALARQTDRVDVIVNLETTKPADDDYVTIKDTYRLAPTFDDPRDMTVTRYTVSARVANVEYLLPGGSEPFVTADPHLDAFAE